MSSLNRVDVIGNLGNDPETRTVGDASVCTISVATSEKWTDKRTGEKQERTEWHRIQLWGPLGEIAQRYLKKGSKVFVSGSLRTDKYQDKQTGQDRYSTSIRARDMVMLGEGGGRESDAPSQAPSAPSSATGGGADFADDIPFNAVPWGATL